MRPERRADTGPTASFAAFVAHHDALSQHRVAIVAHALRVAPFALFSHHRAVLWDAWGDLAPRHEADRLAVSSLVLVRAAGALASLEGPATPRAALDAVREMPPRWRHPDPWTLLAPRDMRGLRALVHLDPTSRDLAALQWLGVDPAAAAVELGLAEDEYRRRRDHAMAFWAHLVRGDEA